MDFHSTAVPSPDWSRDPTLTAVSTDPVIPHLLQSRLTPWSQTYCSLDWPRGPTLTAVSTDPVVPHLLQSRLTPWSHTYCSLDWLRAPTLTAVSTDPVIPHLLQSRLTPCTHTYCSLDWPRAPTLTAVSTDPVIPHLTGGHYVFGQNSNHCIWTLCNHIDMKSGMHDQCSFLFLGAEVHHHRSVVPVRSTRALPTYPALFIIVRGTSS